MSRSVVCTQCGHSLSMSDDIYNRRVAGKVVTIKCRQCSTPIRVDGRQDAPGGSAAAPQPRAPAPYDDPLDPFSLPEQNDAAPPKPRPPLPSLDEVVSSAPHIPEYLSQPLPPLESPPEAPLPPGVTPQPPGRAAPPGPPPPRARASAPDAPAAEPPRPPQPAAAAPKVADALPPVPPAPPALATPPAAPQPAPQPPVAAPAAAPAPAFAAAPAAAPAPAPGPAPQAAADPFPIAPPAAVPQDLGIDSATLRDPHAAFRRRSHTRTLALVGGAAVLMGGLFFATRGDDEKKAARREAAPEKPVIGASLAPYRSDAHETMPTPAAPSQPRSTRDSGDSAPVVETGSSQDFAKRFKAASGRE